MGRNINKLEINLSDNVLKQIETMQERIGANTKTELIRRSLALFDYVTNEKKKDKNLQMILRSSNGKEKMIVNEFIETKQIRGNKNETKNNN